MPISALLLTVPPDQQQLAFEVLRADARVTAGEAQAWRIPVVLDTPSIREDREAIDALLGVPGVLGVDVVMVDFSDDSVEGESEGASGLARRHRRGWARADQIGDEE